MSRPAHVHPTPPRQTAWDHATLVAFLLAAAVVGARALMMEVVRDPFDVRLGSAVAPQGCSAAPGLVLDLVACVPALMVLARRVFDRTYALRAPASFFPLALLTGWACASVLWSTDRFMAAVSVAHVTAAVSMMFAVSQLVRSWTRLRVAAGLGFALLLPYVVHGIYYRWVDLPELRQAWVQTQRAAFLREHGWEEDSFQFKQFEQKIMRGEMVGFHASPNSFAAVIVVGLVIGFGLAIQRESDGDGRLAVLPYVLAGSGGLWVLYYCQSKAAAVTPVLAVAIFAWLSKGRPWLRRHWRSAYWGVIATILVIAVAVVMYGRAHGNLHSDSLNFRWRYWVASARMVRDHPVFGSGYANFGPRYLAYRLPEAAEEIKDPHNFAVRIFAELGVVGGVLLFAWLLRLGWELSRPLSPASPGSPISMWALIAMVAMALAINLACSVDWVTDINFAIIELVKRLLFYAALLIGLLVAVLRSTAEPRSDDRPGPWVLAAVLVALGMMGLHNLIDFSVFETGPMFTTFFLTGAALGARTSQPGTGGGRRAIGPKLALGAGVLAWGAAALLLVVPVVEAEGHARAADNYVRSALDRQTQTVDVSKLEAAAEHLDEAVRLVPYNADYVTREAKVIGQMPPTPDRAQRVAAMLDVAVATDPGSSEQYMTRARWESLQERPDRERVLKDYARVMELNPTEVTLRLAYADLLKDYGQKAKAKEQYELALKYNSLYDRTEPKRLTEKQIDEVEAKINEVK